MSLKPSTALQVTGIGLHFVGLSITALIFGAGYVLAIAPMEDHYQGMVNEFSGASKLQGRGDAIRQRHRDASNQLAEREATFARVLSRIPETPRESEYLAQVTELARTCQLRIQQYHPREPVNEGTHTALEVQLDTIANYGGLCRFLDGLRSLPRLCRITRLHVKTNNPGDEDLPVEMTLRIYYAPLSKQPATGKTTTAGA